MLLYYLPYIYPKVNPLNSTLLYSPLLCSILLSSPLLYSTLLSSLHLLHLLYSALLYTTCDLYTLLYFFLLYSPPLPYCSVLLLGYSFGSTIIITTSLEQDLSLNEST